MKKSFLLIVAMLFTATAIIAQTNARLVVRNNSSCPVTFVVVVSSPVPAGTPNCVSQFNSQLIQLAPGGSTQYICSNGLSLPPGVPAPASGFDQYFLGAVVFDYQVACGGSKLFIGDPCIAPSRLAIQPTIDDICNACGTVTSTWTNLDPYTVELIFN